MTKKNLNLNNKLVNISELNQYPFLDGMKFVENKDGLKYLMKDGLFVKKDGYFVVLKEEE